MPYNLKDRKVLVTAGTRGLGAAISRKFMEQGCRIAINYVSSEERAIATAKELESDFGRRVLILKGDMGVADECETVVKKAAEALGGLDVLISNAGWTKISQFEDLFALSEEEWDKCWAVNVKGNMFLFRAAMPILNSNPEGGCFIMTSSVAAIALSGSAMAYSVTKAAQVHLMKCLAQHQGSKIRTNAVLPGLLLTEWGEKFSEETKNAVKQKATLRKETSIEDCAEAFIMVAKNSSLTGQKIQVDSGLYV